MPSACALGMRAVLVRRCGRPRAGVENVALAPSQGHEWPRRAARRRRRTTMTIQRMDNVGIVVDDLEAAIAFFAELGMELEGKAPIEGRLGGPHRRARRRPQRHRHDADPGRPRPARADEVPHAGGDQRRAAERTGEHAGHPSHHVRRRRHRRTSLPACAPTAPNSSARWRSTRTATGSATSAAPRGSSSRWPSSSANGPSRPTCDQPERSAGWTEKRQWEG